MHATTRHLRRRLQMVAQFRLQNEAADLMQLDETALETRLFSRLGPPGLVQRAAQLAAAVHRGALRDEGTPYIRHPLRVALILVEELGIVDTVLVCAALLHDVIEESEDIDYASLSETFGEEVAQLVLCLTDEFKASDVPRAASKKRYLERIARESDRCLIVKLCDRLDNLRSLKYSPRRDKTLYMQEETRQHLLPACTNRNGVFSRLEKLLRDELAGQ
jgi:(p)ppGpp synthase/HD superfamily hydrolase